MISDEKLYNIELTQRELVQIVVALKSTSLVLRRESKTTAEVMVSNIYAELAEKLDKEL